MSSVLRLPLINHRTLNPCGFSWPGFWGYQKSDLKTKAVGRDGALLTEELSWWCSSWLLDRAFLLGEGSSYLPSGGVFSEQGDSV